MIFGQHKWTQSNTMAQQTYLQLINRVLRQLREPEVTDLSANYTKLIADYVNEVKEEVEDSWKWHELRLDITFNTVADTATYDLSDSGVTTSANGEWLVGRTFLLRDEAGRAQAWRDSTSGGQNHRLIEIPRNWGKHRSTVTTDPDQSLPRTFFMDPPEFKFVFEPQEVEQIRLQCFLPQDELVLVGDILTLGHWRPIIFGTTLKALEERGEELGPRGALMQSKFDNSLAQAIAQDISHSPSEMTMDSGQIEFWTSARQINRFGL